MKALLDRVRARSSRIEYHGVTACNDIDRLLRIVVLYDKLLRERCCIDDCGFDVENESIETLRDCMKAIDLEARLAIAEAEKIAGEGK